jgi:DHA2 family multidrug resistance protein
MNYTALDAGLVMTPRGIGSFLSMLTVGRVVKRIDNRLLMMGGFLGLGVVWWILSGINLDVAPRDIAWPLVLGGFSLGFIFVPLTTLAVATLRQDEIQQATGMYNLLRNLGASVGISVLIAMQTRAAQAHQVVLSGHMTPYNQAYRQDLAAIMGALRGLGASAHGVSLVMEYSQLVRQALLLSYMDSFRWMAIICVVCCPLAWIFQKGARGESPAGLE